MKIEVTLEDLPTSSYSDDYDTMETMHRMQIAFSYMMGRISEDAATKDFRITDFRISETTK